MDESFKFTFDFFEENDRKLEKILVNIRLIPENSAAEETLRFTVKNKLELAIFYEILYNEIIGCDTK